MAVPQSGYLLNVWRTLQDVSDTIPRACTTTGELGQYHAITAYMRLVADVCDKSLNKEHSIERVASPSFLKAPTSIEQTKEITQEEARL